ncbi:MAG: hypothetical protein ACRDUA_04710, partial [Micromonosporaceae bacterium]
MAGTAPAVPAVRGRLVRSLLVSLGTRLAQLASLLLVVSTVLFFLLRLSGDVARILAGENADEQTIDAVREQYGLDRHLLLQYAVFI